MLGTHARTQGLVKGKLVVLDNLPQHLRQSMFTRAGEYPVVCRYSSEPGDPGLDVRSPALIPAQRADTLRTAYPSHEGSP